jgi:hypothetical protein
MTDLRRRKVIVYSLLGALVLFIVIKGVGLATTTFKAMNQRLPSTYRLRSEDSLLFNEENRRKLAVVEVQNSTVRHPVSLITYDGEYSLIVHPLDVVPNSLYKGSFVVEEESTDASNGVAYAVVDNNAFKFKYAVKANPAVSQVYLTLHGDSVQQVMQNDSMVCYSLRCKDLSVRYGKDNPVDLYVKADKFFSSGVPMSVLLYRKNNSLYVLLLSPNKKKNLDPQLLPGLVSGS